MSPDIEASSLNIYASPYNSSSMKQDEDQSFVSVVVEEKEEDEE